MAIMIKHMANLDRGDPRQGKWGDAVLSKEADGHGFYAGPRRASREFANKEKFVGMERIRGVIMKFPVVYGR